MESKSRPPAKNKATLLTFAGKINRFRLSAVIMLLLVLAPFGLYAALSVGSSFLADFFFAVLAASMLGMLLVS